MGNLAADVLLWEAHRQGDDVDLALFATAPRKGSVALSGDGLLHAAGRSPADAAGRILFGEAWKAFGYGNPVLGATVTGAAVLAALQDQWKASGAGVSTSPMAVSANVSYEVDLGAAPGSRVVPASVKINDVVLDPAKSYRIAALAYTLIAADGTTALAEFTDPVRHERDREAFIAYLRVHPTIDPPPLTRVRPAGGTGEGSR